MNTRTLLHGTLWLLALAALAGAADWPQFRGPGGLGISTAKSLPTTWSERSNIVWTTELPGPGGSSPIVVGNQVFVTCYSGYGVDDGGDMDDLKRHLVCLDRGGKIKWVSDVAAVQPEQAYRAPYITLHGYASSTPASDGERVYVFFGKSGVCAFDLEGKKLWQTSVGTGTHNWGSGTSPVLTKDLVIVNASVESRSLVALRKDDGSVAWTAKGMDASWNTPLLVDVNGRQELVVSVRGRLRAFNPETGAELWSCRAINDYVCPSVIAHDGVVYVIGGRSNTCLAVRAGGKGDVTESQVLWRTTRGSNVSSPVYHDGHLYWAHEGRGIVYCVNAETGDVVYEERLKPNPNLIYASALAADGKLYYVSRTNGVYVLEAKPRFRLLAHNRIASDKSVFNGTPAVHEGQLLLRSNRHLYCIGARK